MQVDDKLAKEKLIRAFETTFCTVGGKRLFMSDISQLIRNTDLTDCQQQGKWCNYCRKDNHNDSECWSTRPVNWKPEGLVNVFGNPIAPAPDQGSVRNATDMEELHTMQLVAISVLSHANTEESLKQVLPEDSPYRTVAYDDVLRAIRREIAERERADAAIRALPDQKD